MATPTRSRPPALVSPRGASLGVSHSQQFARSSSPFTQESQLKRQLSDSRKDLKILISEVTKIKETEAQELGEIWKLVNLIKGDIGGFKKWNNATERPQDTQNRSEFGLLANQINSLKAQIKEIKEQTETKGRVWRSHANSEEHLYLAENERKSAIAKGKK
ncbi:unnamed protein product [Blepharisma stoltei]|uniref:Uncharacterized protein n=1 Tax=Blepharisma stoltei TaxID=1481888 RepID=A0AAU9JLM0_9CILI|nr:unnamed protein product [Blepharisma stoltei]